MLYLDITLMLSTTEIDLKLYTTRKLKQKHLSCPQRWNPFFRDK